MAAVLIATPERMPQAPLNCEPRSHCESPIQGSPSGTNECPSYDKDPLSCEDDSDEWEMFSDGGSSSASFDVIDDCDCASECTDHTASVSEALPAAPVAMAKQAKQQRKAKQAKSTATATAEDKALLQALMFGKVVPSASVNTAVPTSKTALKAPQAVQARARKITKTGAKRLP
uniref:Uncharacterized protein n=1 Tax=Eutreptiella gymnastica TaxID=73025 RepID=A0A7S1I1N4_9EUGL|mmetsp:Transcript_121716/g.211399  ORF Transcript_121716/g.211399 Transcript_121716/m.211399 type:complete len:174 (+) Transcript_121716:63-584(+)